MGILGAMSTAVSGLSAQSYALENISGNIANSQTVGFKRVDTAFVNFIPSAPAGHETSGSVGSLSLLSNALQGGMRSTGIQTNMALSGDGYFAVSRNTGSLTAPTFNGSNLYTRRGDFSLDSSRYLRNGAGLYLNGTSYSVATGAVTGSATSPIRISDEALPPRATGLIQYSGNLPATPKPASFSVSKPGSDLLKPSDFATDPVTSGTVTGADEASFLHESIPGGDVSLYDSAGTASTAQLRWAKTASSPDSWMLFYRTNSAPAATDIAWKSVGATVKFNANGLMTSVANLTIPAVAIDGHAIGDVNLSFANGGLTQYGDVSGTATPRIVQDGYTTGTLVSISVSSDGVISGSYSNGQIAKIAEVTVARFAGNNALHPQDGGAYAATSASGTPTYGLQGTTLASGSVEESNTDISDEFSKMIVTQQAYSANARIISTAQQMLQEVISSIR